jgi:hypothetical protein
MRGMPMTKLKKIRKQKMNQQRGRCWYCDAPMWEGSPELFARRFGLSLTACERFRCTAEHLRAASEGGPAAPDNIVAAHAFCNRLRHARPKPLAPEPYRALVKARMAKGAWHGLPASS